MDAKFAIAPQISGLSAKFWNLVASRKEKVTVDETGFSFAVVALTLNFLSDSIEELVMQKLITLSFTFAAMLSSAVCGEELAVNGNFESGTVDNWVSFPSGDSTFEITSDANSGSFAGELFNNASGSAAVIKQANLGIGSVIAGQEITVSFAAKGEGVEGGVAFAEFFSEIDGGGTSKTEIFGGGPLSLTDQWQIFNFETTAGPDVSGGVSLQFNAATGANAGSTSRIFVDDVSISIATAIPEPSSIAFLGLLGLSVISRRRRQIG